MAWILSADTATVRRHIAGLHTRPAPPSLPRAVRAPLSVEQQSTLIAFYCQTPPPPGMQRWTLRTAAKEITATGLLSRSVHPSTIARVLRRHQLRPHKIAYYLHVRDPMFFERMHHVLGVYATKSDHIFCFDECPSIQAVSRRGPHTPCRNASTSIEFVYQRNGTTDLYGFLHVSTGKVAGYCRPTHETSTLIEVFTAHVQSQSSSEQLHYICDNLSPHFNEKFCKAVANLCNIPAPSALEMSSGQKRRQWLQRPDKRIVVHFLPFHGSWLNQVEIWFGLLKRYVLTGGWFDSVDDLNCAIMAFVDTWNERLAHPFDFRYDGKGLENVVIRRFCRIFSQNDEALAQLDSKFIADISLLCVSLINNRRHHINDTDWHAFSLAVNACKPQLTAIIEAEPGPKRRPRACKAFQTLCQCLVA